MRQLLGLAGLVLAAVSACAPVSGDGAYLAAAAPRETYLWGTGFFIDRNGLILTAHHLVRDCARIDVVAGERRERAALVASSAVDDLSLLRVAGSFGAPLPVAEGGKPPGGAFVAILGYAALHAGRRPAALNSMVLDERAPRHIALISEAAPGYSGSPVVTSDGSVIGVLESQVTERGGFAMAGRPRDIRLAVSGAAVRAFLREEGVAPAEGAASPEGSDLVQRLAAAEVKVECHWQSGSFGSQSPKPSTLPVMIGSTG